MMRSALTVLSMLAFSQFACAQDAASAGTSPDAIIVSEFGKFLELELRDCIAGYDSLLSQEKSKAQTGANICLLYTSPSPRDQRGSRMPSSA